MELNRIFSFIQPAVLNGEESQALQPLTEGLQSEAHVEVEIRSFKQFCGCYLSQMSWVQYFEICA